MLTFDNVEGNLPDIPMTLCPELYEVLERGMSVTPTERPTLHEFLQGLVCHK